MAEVKPQEKKILSFDPYKLEILPDGKFKLLGTKCNVCGATTLGTHPACQKCFSPDVKSVALTHSGAIQNYSIIYLKPSAEWKGPVPYVLGEVKLPEGPVVTTYIINKEPKDIKVGLKVKMALNKADQDELGNDIMSYVWTPA